MRGFALMESAGHITKCRERINDAMNDIFILSDSYLYPDELQSEARLVWTELHHFQEKRLAALMDIAADAEEPNL